MKFLDKFCIEDNEIIYNFMYQEYWYLQLLSCIYPNLTTKKWRVISFLILTFIGLMLLQHIILFTVSASKSVGDIFQLFQNVHFIILITIILLIPLQNFCINRPVVAKVHYGLATGMSNYDNITEQFRDKLKIPVAKRKKIVMILMSVVYAGQAALFGVIGPTLDKNSKDYTGDIYSPSGVSLNLPAPAWTPTGTDTWYTHSFQYINQVAAAGITISILAAADLMLFVVFQNLALEIDLMSYSLKRLPERVRLLYQERFGREINNINTIREDKDLSDCYKECLKQNVIHHQKIITTTIQYGNIISHLVFLVHSLGAVIIAIAGALIVLYDGKPGTQATSLGFCVFETLNIFYIDWCCEELVQACLRLRDQIYSTDWMNTRREESLTIQIMQLRCVSPLTIRFYSLMTFNYETFAVMMNSTYSYLNLLFAFVD